MRIKAITCEVLARAVYLNAAYSPHVVDIELEDKGLHYLSATLRRTVQQRIDATSAQEYQAIVLVYGLCNRSLEGLRSRDVPLVVPRAHDCITLYLGSRAAYDREFAETPGTFYYSDEYLERGGTKGKNSDGRIIALGATTAIDDTYEQLVAKYGEDNAAYLLEVLGDWQKHYERAAYIDMQLGKSGDYVDRAKRDAAERGWRFEMLKGDLALVRRLVFGEWDGDDFLVVQPGQRIVATFDAQIIAAEAGPEADETGTPAASEAGHTRGTDR
jgi:hypothetical protein